MKKFLLIAALATPFAANAFAGEKAEKPAKAKKEKKAKKMKHEKKEKGAAKKADKK